MCNGTVAVNSPMTLTSNKKLVCEWVYTQRLSCKYYLISHHLTLILQHQQNNISGVCVKQRQPRRTETPWNNHYQTITLTRARSGEKEVSVWTYPPSRLSLPLFPSPTSLGIWVRYGWTYSPPFTFSLTAPPSLFPPLSQLARGSGWGMDRPIPLLSNSLSLPPPSLSPPPTS